MPQRSILGEPAGQGEWTSSVITPDPLIAADLPIAPDLPIASGDLPIASGDLQKLARWIPKKEMALLIEICERARCDGDLARPALLLCRAYVRRVAHMLDQDPLPTFTQQITERLRHLGVQNGL